MLENGYVFKRGVMSTEAAQLLAVSDSSLFTDKEGGKKKQTKPTQG